MFHKTRYLPLEQGSDRCQTLPKRVSDNSRQFIFQPQTKIETSNSRLPPEDGSVRPQTFGKRVSDDPRHFIFRRRKHFSAKLFRPKHFHDAKKFNYHFLKNYDNRPKENHDWIGFWNESRDVCQNSSKSGVLKIWFLQCPVSW